MSRKRTLAKVGLGVGVFFAAAAGILVAAYQRDLYVGTSGSPPEVVIRGGMLFAGTGPEAVENPGIVLRAGTIACMGRTCAPSAEALEIDATGLAIVPGLIDLHGHFFGRRTPANLVALIWDTARMRPGFRREMLEAGVTSVRSVGDPGEAILEVKRLIAERELQGPRLFVAGPIFTAPGGHPAYGGQDPNPSGVGGWMTFQSDDPTQVRAEVLRLAEHGVDGIKAVFHGNVSPTGETLLPTISAATLAALIDAAQGEGLWVAVHVGPLHETAQAAWAGVTTVEHGVRSGNAIDASTLEALVANDVVYVPTLGQEPGAEINIPALYGAGVLLGVGTDVADYHDELARLADAGMPAAAVLRAATANGAAGLLRRDELGTIEAGKIADVVLVDGEPWNDIRDLRSIVTVIKDGFIVVDHRTGANAAAP